MVDVLVRNKSVHDVPAMEAVSYLRDAHPELTVTLADTPELTAESIPTADVIVGGSLSREELAAAEQLALFACCYAGVGHLDLDAFAEQDVIVTNASGVHGPNIAEHVLGWMLLITRRLDEGLRRQRRHEWRHFTPFGELAGSRVTIVGMGAIGQAIVERLDGFDVTTVGVRHSPEKGGPTDEVYGYAALSDALVDAHYVVLACPLTDLTRGLIDGEALGTIPKDAVLINIARGGVIDTDALVDALRGNKLHAAALDVTDPEPLPADHPLWDLGNCYITPHNSGATPHYWTRVAEIVSRNLTRLLDDGDDTDFENRVV